MTLPKDLFTKFAIGIICGYLVAFLGLPIHAAVTHLIRFFVTPASTTGGLPTSSFDFFFIVSQVTAIAIVVICTIVAVLSPTLLAAFRRLAFVLVPCIIFNLFIHISVLIFGD